MRASESRRFQFDGRQHLSARMVVGGAVSPGSESRACRQGSSGNPGGLDVSTVVKAGWASAITSPGPAMQPPASLEANMTEDQVVGPSEEQRARTDERRGVGASHSTDEVGESCSGRPGGGKGMPRSETVGGNDG